MRLVGRMASIQAARMIRALVRLGWTVEEAVGTLPLVPAASST